MRDLCIRALRKTGAFSIGDGSSLPAEDVDNAKQAINSFINSMAGDITVTATPVKRVVNTTDSVIYLTTSDHAGEYSGKTAITSCPDVPASIEQVLYLNGTEYINIDYLSVNDQMKRYNDVTDYPTTYSYTFNGDNGAILLNPIPPVGTQVMVITNETLGTYELDDSIPLPEIYLNWIVLSVAGKYLAIDYGVNGQASISLADEIYQRILRTKKRTNIPDDIIRGYDLMTNSGGY